MDEYVDAGSIAPDQMKVGPRDPRPFDIAGIPQTIARADYDSLIGSLGIELRWLRSLRFGYSCIEAEVVARNAAGNPYRSADGEGAAVHHVSIPVVD